MSRPLPDGGSRREDTPVVVEAPGSGEPPLYVHDGWASRFPWLVQGTTARGADGAPFDLGLFGAGAVDAALSRWRAVRHATGCARAVHARQVHGSRVLAHGDGPPGLLVADDADGHITTAPGVLLTVSVADCVPIFVVDPRRRAVALLHGGWRGVARGILERGLATLRSIAGSEPADLYLHLGPAICGECYEVGPEVHEALGLSPPPRAATLDLRAVVSRRALRLGVATERTSISAHCTRCAPDRPFFSHRAGDTGRQMAVIGLKP